MKTMFKVGKKVGTVRYKYSVAMVNKRTHKFKGFLHSNSVTCDRIILGVKKERNYRTKEMDSVVNRGVPDNKQQEALEKCKRSIEVKVKRYLRLGYLPLKEGWKPVTRDMYNNKKQYNKGIKWTDIVMLIPNHKSVSYY